MSWKMKMMKMRTMIEPYASASFPADPVTARDRETLIAAADPVQCVAETEPNLRRERPPVQEKTGWEQESSWAWERRAQVCGYGSPRQHAARGCGEQGNAEPETLRDREAPLCTRGATDT
jgi:hypothetical protein